MITGARFLLYSTNPEAARAFPGDVLECPLGALAAVNARRAEEDDRVLDVLLAEAAQRLEVLGNDANRAGLLALEEIAHQVRQRLTRHASTVYQRHGQRGPPPRPRCIIAVVCARLPSPE